MEAATHAPIKKWNRHILSDVYLRNFNRIFSIISRRIALFSHLEQLVRFLALSDSGLELQMFVIAQENSHMEEFKVNP